METTTAMQAQRSEIETAFSLAQREAKALVDSGLLPEPLRNVGAAMQVIAMARETHLPAFMLAQSLYAVKGKIGLSASYMIALANQHPKMEQNLRWSVTGTWPAIEVTCHGRLLGDPKDTERTVTLGTADAKEMGWATVGDKYKSRASATHMLKFRTATWWVRENVPEVLLGLHTDDEIRDSAAVYIDPVPPRPAALPETHQIAPAPSIDIDPQAELDKRAQREPTPREEAKTEAAHDGDLSPEDRLRAEIEELEEAAGVMPDERGRFRGDHGLAVPFSRATMEQLRAYKTRIVGGAK